MDSAYPKSGLGLVLAAILLDTSISSVVLPIVPDVAQSLRLTPAEWGFALALYPIAQIVFQPLWGFLCTRFSSEFVISLSLFGKFTAFGIFLYADSGISLGSSLFCMGMLGGCWVGSQSLVVQRFADSEHARLHSRFAASFGLGIFIGPATAALAYFLSGSGNVLLIWYGVPILIVTVLLVRLLILVFSQHPSSQTQSDKNAPSSLSMVLRSPAVVTALGGTLFFGLLAQMYMVALPVWVMDAFGWTAFDLGVVYALAGAAMICTQLFLVERLLKKYPEIPILFTAALAVLLSYALPLVSSELIVAYLCIAMYTYATAVSVPVTSHLIGRSTNDANAGAVYGLNSSLFAVGRALGPLVAGLFASLAGSISAFVAGVFVSITLFALYIWGVNRI